MAENKYRGEVLIELDRPRKFRLTFNRLIEFEKLVGKQFDIAKLASLSLEETRALLYVALKEEDATLTLEQVGDLIALSDYRAVLNALIESAWGGKVPEEVTKNAVSPQTEIPTVGTSGDVSSGPSVSE